MALTLETESIPLAIGDDGLVRVGGTRVTLDAVAASFSTDAAAEEIMQKFPSLDRADVYEVLGCYLRHAGEVEAYLGERRANSKEIRQDNEFRFDPQGCVRPSAGAQPQKIRGLSISCKVFNGDSMPFGGHRMEHPVQLQFLRFLRQVYKSY